MFGVAAHQQQPMMMYPPPLPPHQTVSTESILNALEAVCANQNQDTRLILGQLDALGMKLKALDQQVDKELTNSDNIGTYLKRLSKKIDGLDDPGRRRADIDIDLDDEYRTNSRRYHPFRATRYDRWHPMYSPVPSDPSHHHHTEAPPPLHRCVSCCAPNPGVASCVAAATHGPPVVDPTHPSPGHHHHTQKKAESIHDVPDYEVWKERRELAQMENGDDTRSPMRR
jgi:hypothetical protein